MSENPVAVTQADRDAAGDIWRDFVARTGECITEKAIRSGGIDDGALVQAFARHRLAGLEREADGAPGGGSVGVETVARQASPVVADYGEHFLVAHVSKDGKMVGIDHPCDAVWADVLAAHVALRDRINERIAALDGCPFNPTPPASVSGEVVVEARALGRARAALQRAAGALRSAEARETRKSRKGWAANAARECDEANTKLSAAPEAATPSAASSRQDLRALIARALDGLDSIAGDRTPEFFPETSYDCARRIAAEVRSRLATIAPDKAPSAVGGVDRMREAIVRIIMDHVVDGDPETPEDAADAILALASGETSPERGRGE